MIHAFKYNYEHLAPTRNIHFMAPNEEGVAKSYLKKNKTKQKISIKSSNHSPPRTMLIN